MSNTTLTADVIAKEAVMILENNLVMAKQVHRGYESEFDKKVNGYEVGETISIRRPADFEVTDGATMQVQDVVEGKLSLTVDTRKHVAFKFTSQDLTMKIGDLGERVMKPALVQLANQIDTDGQALYKKVPNWVGTPGQTINSFTDFYAGVERLNEYAVPLDSRYATLSPADHSGLLGSQTALYIGDAAKGAYRNAALGDLGGVETFMSQNVPTHTVGSDVSGTVNGAVTASTLTYNDVKNTMQQTITVASLNLNAGDVFTIADVYAVNPVSKAKLPFNKQFTVVSYSSNTLVFYPAMIWSGPFQNIAVTSGVTDLDTKAITAVGSANGNYRQNMIFAKDAFTLAMVPLVAPPGAVDVATRSHKGITVRVIPVYDGVSDESRWRLDVLYGWGAIDPRKATRLSGAS